MAWDKNDFLDIEVLTRVDIETILNLAEKLEPYSGINDKFYEPLHICEGKILANVFFEDSTRTRISTQVAMSRLGGGSVNFDKTVSSINKGESFEDTLCILDGYCDIFAIRHSGEYSVFRFADLLDKPVINAGDGKNQHPTQTMLDLYTIRKEFGKIDGSKIVLIGDLKYGRTVHSLARALENYNDVELIGICPEGLEMPSKYENCETRVIDTKNLNEVLSEIGPDVVYATRIQKERMPEGMDAEKYRYVINEQTLGILPDNCIIMHPLPRVDELQIEWHGKKQRMFEQASYGVPTRMAIISILLGYEKEVMEL